MTRLERLTMIRISPLAAALAVAILLLSAAGCSSSSGGGGRLIPVVDDAVADDGGDVSANSGGAGASDEDADSGAGADVGAGGGDTEARPTCELTSTRAGCDTCLANFCQFDCAACTGAGEPDCGRGYSCVADECSDPEEETDLDCVVDCASDDDGATRALYSLIDCGKLNCPGYCHF